MGLLSGLLKHNSRTFCDSPCPMGAASTLCHLTLRLSRSPTSHCTSAPSQGPGETGNTLSWESWQNCASAHCLYTPFLHQANALWVGASRTDAIRGLHLRLRLNTLNTITFPPPHLCLDCIFHLEFPSVSLLLLISNLTFKVQMPLPPCSLPRLPQLGKVLKLKEDLKALIIESPFPGIVLSQ